MLTKKKKLFAKSREAGNNRTQSAIYAGFPKESARAAGSRYDRDPDVIRFRERIRSESEIDYECLEEGDMVPEPKPKPQKRKDFTPPPEKPDDRVDTTATIPMTVPNESAAVSILRAQLHSDDERIAQGAAKALLDYENKKLAATGGKKKQKEDAAKSIAGKFAGLRAVKS